MQNPSIVLYGVKEAKLEDKEIPELTDPHDVLVRIAYVGVCGSDVSTAGNDHYHPTSIQARDNKPTSPSSAPQQHSDTPRFTSGTTAV